MNYYYDVILNFNMEKLWNFYEWEKEDSFSYAKKIPLFRVSFETIADFMQYHVMVSDDFLHTIEHKTIAKDSQEDLTFCFLISDTKNSLAVLLNEQGEVIAMSHLELEDENNLNEFMYTIKEKKIEYQKSDKRMIQHELRQEIAMKNLISVELKTLYETKNKNKLKYLYYEWFNEELDDLEVMYQNMQNELKKTMNETLQTIYYFIRLSYHQV